MSPPNDYNKDKDKSQSTISHYFSSRPPRQSQSQSQVPRKRSSSPPASKSTNQDPLSSPNKRPKPSSPFSRPSYPQSTPSQTLKITHKKGDLFTLPPPRNALLVHACNTQGHWGAGIAKLFASKFPEAYQVYKKHCFEAKRKGEGLVGRVLVIPPDFSSGGEGKERRQFIGCLFTSEGFGRRKASSEQILRATESAMGEMLEWVGEWNRDCLLKQGGRKRGGKSKDGGDDEGEEEEEEDDRRIHTIHMCKINAGLFDVPWEETLAVLESIEIPASLRGEKEEGGDGEGEEGGVVIGRVEVISP